MTVDIHYRADLRVPKYLHRDTGRDSLRGHQWRRPVPQVMVAHGRDTGLGEQSAEAEVVGWREHYKYDSIKPKIVWGGRDGQPGMPARRYQGDNVC